jgi:hypothetical protein
VLIYSKTSILLQGYRTARADFEHNGWHNRIGWRSRSQHRFFFFCCSGVALPLSTLVQTSGIRQMNADKTVDSNFFIIFPQLLKRVSIQNIIMSSNRFPVFHSKKESTSLDFDVGCF